MTLSLIDGLPVVKVRIGHSDAWRELCDRNLEPVPPDITVNALIDTGASITVLDAALVRRLGLRDRGVCRVRGFDGSLHADPATREYFNYDISLSIPGAEGGVVLRVGDLQVVGAPLSCAAYDMLLGLDVLRHCTLTLRLAESMLEITAA